MAKPPMGSIAWADLTVPDAEGVRTFYESVVGWKSEGVDMGGYQDWMMSSPATGTAAAGVCWARGTNAGLPAQWLIYIIVADVDAAVARCRELGGEVVREPRGSGTNRFCVIRDPAGAVCALVQGEAD